jgi:hypothetical protein
LDAGVDGQADIVSLHRVAVADFAFYDTFGIALQDARAGGAAEFVVEGQFELRFALAVGLVEVEAGGVLLVDFRRGADIAEEMGPEGSVGVAAHGADGEVDAGDVDAFLGKARHGLEVEVLEIQVGHLGVVAEVEAELVGVVVAGQAEFGQAGHDGFVDDLDDVRFGFLGEHPADGGAVIVLRHVAVAVAVFAHHVGEVELDRVARAVLGEGQSVAIGDFAAHGGEADVDLGVAAEAVGVFAAARDLDIPKAGEEQSEARRDHGCYDGDAEPVRAALHGVSRLPRRACWWKPPGKSRKKK